MRIDSVKVHAFPPAHDVDLAILRYSAARVVPGARPIVELRGLRCDRDLRSREPSIGCRQLDGHLGRRI